MENYCRNCGEKLKENQQFCAKCGKEVNPGFFNKKTVILILIIAAIIAAGCGILIQPSTQIVEVDNVKFEIPADYVNEPSRTEVSYDENVKSSAMGWSNNENYIEIGITRTPGAGINGNEIAASLGGTPTKMYGYTGYYLDYELEGHAFVFGMKDKVCMIYVSDYDAFDDVKVIG